MDLERPTPLTLWLDDPAATDAARVGPKAARLATLRQAGLPVPPAFVLTTAAFAAGMTGEVEAALRQAHLILLGSYAMPPLSPPSGERGPGGEGQSAGERLAVRSSATAEDLADGSLAGMQATVLNVGDEAALVAAVQRVWASLASPEARAYRARAGLAEGAMAVLVQRQVAARVAGIAFGRDPISAEPVVVIEAVAGLGDALASGDAEPQRWRVARRGEEIETLLAPPEPLLDEATLAGLVALVERAEGIFGGPQDVEWGWDGERLWLLQSRPITGRGEDWFSDRLPDDRALWTAAFLNERFTQPISPLGWTLVAAPLERLALRAPLELLGAATLDGPLLKLWRGHPYTRVEAWQRLYKLFPDALLPEDAARFFPEGDVSLRRAPRQPTWGFHLILNGLRALRQHPRAASPLHNPQGWARWEQRLAAALLRLRFAERHLPDEPDPLAAARALLQETAALTDELLEFHRWSLLYADLSFSLLRRWLRWRYGAAEGSARAARLAAHAATPTAQANRALAALTARAAASPDALAWLQAVAAGNEAAPPPSVAPFHADLRRFLDRFGHRFFSLDFFDPPWQADLPAFARFLLALAGGGETERQKAKGKRQKVKGTADDGLDTAESAGTSHIPHPTSHIAHPTPHTPHSTLHTPHLSSLPQQYLYLREAQRFRWQEILALQRRVVVWMGTWWVARGRLGAVEDVFGLTWDELLAGEPDGARAAARMAHLRRLRDQARQAPGWHYPDFLRGNAPLRTVGEGATLVGRAVSPGVARGPARLVAHPSDFARLRPGDILVTSSPDPGWTPIFGTVAGMVTERGGQLSHGAVVAREVGLPAVSGIPGLLARLRDGEPLLVDGTQGVVVREGAAMDPAARH